MADIDNKDIEFLWQEEVLSQHGEFLMDLFQDTITEKNIRVSDDLMDSLNYSAFREGEDRGLRINFFEHGRFIEIRKHKKRNRMDTKTNETLWNAKDNSMSRKKMKDVDWYSRNAYGSLNRLISIVMNELSTEEMNRLKNIIQNRIQP
jgi:hypothetical protein